MVTTSTVTRWLVDASVVLAREDVDDAHHGDAHRFLGGPHPIATLDLAFYEVDQRDRAGVA